MSILSNFFSMKLILLLELRIYLELLTLRFFKKWNVHIRNHDFQYISILYNIRIIIFFIIFSNYYFSNLRRQKCDLLLKFQKCDLVQFFRSLGKRCKVQGVQEFFSQFTATPPSPTSRCKRPSKLSTQCECNFVSGW